MHTRERAVLLEGLIVEGGNGCSRAASLARRHLVALGCRPATTDAVWPRHPQADPSRGAEWIALGSGNASGCRHVVECSIDAAGPVRLPLEDETTVQAACGVMHVHGRKSGRPEPLFVDYVSAVSGVLAVQGLLAGFLARLRGAEFARVSTSLAQAALLTVSQYLAAATADESAERFNVGGPPFISLDGVRFEIEALEAGGWRAFWGLFDVDPGAVARGWRPFRDRYSTATCPLPIELHSGAERRPFSEILSCAKIAGISAVAVSGLTDVRGSEGPDRPTEPPWQFASGEGFAPPLGILPPGAPLPLQGLTVVESARRIQGPLAAHVLARLGARVIRIEPPGGDPMRGMPPLVDGCSARFLALNAGKGVVEADLKCPAGQRSFEDVVTQADVFLHNWTAGTAADLGLDFERLASLKPGLVYAHASGWGDAFGSDPPLGTDFLVQAHSGLAAAVRPPGDLPAPSLMTLTDVLGGLISAQAVLAALVAKQLTRHGCRVDSSLFSAARLLLEERTRLGAARGLGARPARLRPLPTADGYLALPDRAWLESDRLAAACGLPSTDTMSLAPDYPSRFRLEDNSHWVGRLQRAGLNATPVCLNLADLAADAAFGAALSSNGCTFVRSPWSFER